MVGPNMGSGMVKVVGAATVDFCLRVIESHSDSAGASKRIAAQYFAAGTGDLTCRSEAARPHLAGYRASDLLS